MRLSWILGTIAEVDSPKLKDNMLSPTITIRRAEPRDDLQIGEILVDAFVFAYSKKMPEFDVPDARKQELRNVANRRVDGVVLVGELDGTVSGTVTIYPPELATPYVWRSNTCEIRFLATKPELHGKSGLAGKLMDEAERLAKEWRANGICLRVRTGLDRLARYYESRGYKRDTQGDKQYSPTILLKGFFLELRQSST